MAQSEIPLARFFRAPMWGLAALTVHALAGLALPSADASRSVAAPSLTIAFDACSLGEGGETSRAGGAPSGRRDAPGAPAQASRAPRAADASDRRLPRRREAAPARARSHESVASTPPESLAAGSPEPLAPPAGGSLAAPAEPAALAAAAGATGSGVASGRDARANEAGEGAGGDGASAPGDSGSGSGDAPLRGPNLLAYASPCVGLFPTSARASHGEVQLALDVDTRGRAHARAVLAEQPGGQGFGSAARACAHRLVFAPAVARSGAPVPGQAKVKLRFDRR